MSDDDLEKTLQTFAAVLNDVVTKAICEDFARKGRDGDPGGFALEDVPKVLKVRVAPTNGGVLQFEGGYVGPTDDLIVCVHASGSSMSLRVLDLTRILTERGSDGAISEATRTDLDL